MTNTLRSVAIAATLGSMIEWYDLFVYGSLVVVLSKVFFPVQDASLSLLYALAAFVAGAAVRPIGGAIFGRLGDTAGRKRAFILTVLVMGLGATLTGLLPTYQQAGIIAPILLVVVRVVQGLALGGEFGGAVTYLAEHTDAKSRGRWTGLIQATATLGLLLSSAVVLAARVALGVTTFSDWGWRLPFLLSSVLILVAFVARRRLGETPPFTSLIESGTVSVSPIRESLTDRANLGLVLLAVVVVSGASVIWHTAQFYTTIFMQSVLKIDLLTTTMVLLIALAFSAPLFVVFGWLSDKVGRLRLLLLANILGAVGFLPIYVAMKSFSSPLNVPGLVLMVFSQTALSAMAYGPLAAYLAELFPTRIRYTSLSVPYGIGTGDVGDGTLLIAPALTLATGNIYAGLVWSTAVPLLAFIIVLAYGWRVRRTGSLP
ncbi:MAG: MFS transporter [Nitrososphaerales archaeon]|nr:MFS transporter [Nitrososphaerales archaeon]